MHPPLLPILADALESAGFPTGVGWHVRVRLVLETLPADCPEDQLRDALCAVTATSPDEQERFYAIFEKIPPEYQRRMGAYNLKPPAKKTAPPPGPNTGGKEAPPPPGRLPWKTLAAAALVLLAAVAWWRYCGQTPTPDTVASTVQIEAGRASIVVPDSNVLRDFGPPARARFEAFSEANKSPLRPDKLEKEPLFEFEVQSAADTLLRTALADYALSDSSSLRVQARDSSGAETLRIRLENRAGKTRLWELVVQIEPGTAGTEPPPDIATGPPLPPLLYEYRAEREALLLNLAVEPQSALQRWITRYHWPLKAALWLFLAAGLYAWLQYRQRRRPLTAARERPDQSPYVWDVKLGDERPPEQDDTFFAIANRLRRRESAETRFLDLPATIRATIESGGLPAFRYREHTRPPEYLLLIDKQDANDHRAALFAAIAAAFQKQEVLLDRFFFMGDPRLCWNDEHPAGIGIRELLYRYPNARLILLGDGHRLLSSGRPAPWTQTLDAWKQRALLTPVPPARWRLNEQRLAERFTVLPALLDSLELLSELDRHVETGLFPLTEAARGQADHPAAEVPVVLGGPLIAALRDHYSAAQIRWIAACAVWPSLHFDLTLWLGRLLQRTRTGPAAAIDQCSIFKRQSRDIATEDLRQLTRLDWFVQGRIPDRDRLALLEWLEQDSPGLLRRIQAALYRLLAAQKFPDTRSAASPGYRMHLALLGWMSADTDAERTRHAGEIKQNLDHARPDVTALKALHRRSLLDVLVPPQLRRQIHPGGFPALGWRPFWRDALLAALVLLAAAAGAVLWQPAPPACTGDPMPYQGRSLCLKTAADRALYRECLLCDTLENKPLPPDSAFVWGHGAVEDSLVRAELPPGDSARAGYEFNVAIARHNLGWRLAVRADSLRRAGRQADYAGTRSLACELFRRAAQTNSAYNTAAIAAASAWCAEGPSAALSEPKPAYDYTPAPDEPAYMKHIRYIIPSGIVRTLAATQVTRQINLISLHHTLAPTIKQYKGRKTVSELVRFSIVEQGLSDVGWHYLVTPDGMVWLGRPLDKTPAVIFKRNEGNVGVMLLLSGDVELPTPVQERSAGILISALCNKFGIDPKVNFSPDGGAFHSDYDLRTGELLGPKPGGARKTSPGKLITKPMVLNWVETYGRPAATPPTETRTATTYTPGRRPAEDMVQVPGGAFTMGCRDEKRDGDCNGDEKPPREVTLRDFYIDRTEVTNAQYAVFLNEYGSDKVLDGPNKGQEMIYEHEWGVQKNADGRWVPAPGKAQHPVVNVTWYGADTYARHYGCRLPTEAEWEYAVRGGQKGLRDDFRYAGSNDIAEVAWYDGNSGDETHAVRQKKANQLGLFDMSGNVWEWCADAWHDNYEGALKDGRAWMSGGDADRAVLRGGSWLNDEWVCRVAYRFGLERTLRDLNGGFRLARDGSAGGQ